MISKKHFLIGIALGMLLLVIFVVTLPDSRLHIVFCDVGQGDAAYIRTPQRQDIVIDGGPNDRVLTCLGRHMPFYDRTIDVVVMTHPQKDHMQGLIGVLDRYRVGYFIATPVSNETDGYQALLTTIKRKHVPVKNIYAGDSFRLGDVDLKVLWPSREWVAENTIQRNNETMKDLSNVLGIKTDTDLNDFSYHIHLTYGTFDALFTGDGDQRIQPEIMASALLPDVEVLKFPHHGSKTGILPEFLDKIKPEFAVISVGKNSYGHPTKEALNLLEDQSVKTMRTDLEGHVEVVSDGRTWWVKR